MHKPVLLEETVQALRIKPQGLYIDGTLGLGGHAEEITKQLGKDGRLLGLDVDPNTLYLAKDRLQPYGDLTITRQVNFRGLQRVLREIGWDEVDGMIFDLGFSSAQMDDETRGLSFQKEGPLDMRLDPTEKMTAMSLLRTLSEESFVQLLTRYGETRSVRRLAKAILEETTAGRLKTTIDLAEVCVRVLGRHGKTHPATRVFLALRSLVNKEEENLAHLLDTAPLFLKKEGRLAIITFQSLEDALVKKRFRDWQNNEITGKGFSIVTKKPISPSDNEISGNPRSRSAKLRVLERIQ